MSTLPIKTDWTKIPGPRFVGGPDGRILDIEDWRVLVKSHLLLQSAVELTRIEANDPDQMEYAKARSVRQIEDRVYGEVWKRLIELRSELRFSLERDKHDSVIKKYDEIMAIVRPTP